MEQDTGFAVALNCIDGRTQEPLIAWAKQYFGVRYVDIITESGCDGVLQNDKKDVLVSLKRKMAVSVEKHNFLGIVIAGHYDCAGNPVSFEEHVRHIKKAHKRMIRTPKSGQGIKPPVHFFFW